MGTEALLGEKDKKQLVKQLSEQYSNVVETSDLKDLFPSNCKLSLLNVKGTDKSIWLCDGVPIFISFNKRCSSLIPTLIVLWKLPCLLKTLTVVDNAVSFLLNGANLMFPGVLDSCESLLAQDIACDQVWAVRTQSNSMPFAVGIILQTTQEIASGKRKGRLLQPIHILGDMLTKNMQLPEGFSLTGVEAAAEVKSDLMPENSADQCCDEPDVDLASLSEDEARAVFTIDYLSVLLENVLLNVMRYSIDESTLPLPLSSLWSKICTQLAMSCNSDDQFLGKLVSNLCPVAHLNAGESLEDVGDDDDEYSDGDDYSHDNLTQIAEKSNLPCSLEEGCKHVKFVPKVELSQTKWKNIKGFSAFVKSLGVATVKEIKGDLKLMSVNSKHPRISHLASLPSLASRASVSSSSKADSSADAVTGVKLQLVEAYNAVKLNEFCSKKTRMYSLRDVRRIAQEALLDLVKMSRSFSHPDKDVDVDELTSIDLASLLCSFSGRYNLFLSTEQKRKIKDTGCCGSIYFEDAVENFINNGFARYNVVGSDSLSPEQLLVKDSGATVLPAGSYINIRVIKVQRFIKTIVSGVYLFGITNLKQLASDLQKKCNAGATLYEDLQSPGKAKYGVIVQGSFADECVDLMHRLYGIPLNLIKVMN